MNFCNMNERIWIKISNDIYVQTTYEARNFELNLFYIFGQTVVENICQEYK